MRELLGAKRAYGVDEVLSGAVPLSDLPRDEQGLCLIAAPRRLEQSETIVHELPALLDSAMAHFDAIVANTGANWGEQHAVLLERSSRALFLVDQRASSLRACKHAVELCARCGIAASPFLFVANRCSKRSLFSSIDVSCAMQGAHAAELKDGGAEVEQALGTGLVYDLVSSRNAFAQSVRELMGEVAGEAAGTHWLRPKSPRRLRADFSPSGALVERGATMTLLDRVRAAGNETPAASRATRDEMLEWLKERVREQLPADDIASLAKGNPERARNEIRAVCRAAFEGSGRFDTGLAEQEALADTLIDSMWASGLSNLFLADESITEIMVNGSRSLFYERDGVLHQSEFCFASDDEVRMLIDRIIGPLGRRIDESSPMVNARLAQGHRVNAIVPPLALDGPMLTIRTFSSRVITLQDMVESGSIEECVQRLLVWAVRARKSIAVSGGTGSGKTTLLNALSLPCPPDERIITIEDSAELRFLEHPHVVRLEARPRNAEGVGEVTIRDLVANALRMRPDRIIVGECRGGEALDMLSAMNTGHEGSLTTLHANSPQGGDFSLGDYGALRCRFARGRHRIADCERFRPYRPDGPRRRWLADGFSDCSDFSR